MSLKFQVTFDCAQLVVAGGTEVRRVDEEDSSWMVMQDPEGNEFCAVGRPEPE